MNEADKWAGRAAPSGPTDAVRINAAADVLRFHDHWNMLPNDCEAWIVAEKMLNAAAAAGPRRYKTPVQSAFAGLEMGSLGFTREQAHAMIAELEELREAVRAAPGGEPSDEAIAAFLDASTPYVPAEVDLRLALRAAYAVDGLRATPAEPGASPAWCTCGHDQWDHTPEGECHMAECLDCNNPRALAARSPAPAGDGETGVT
jgi:hypothetical protein